MSWFQSSFDWDDYDAASEGHDPPPGALLIDGPLYAENRRGDFGQAWWGQQWVKALERLGLAARLQRGKSYARNGSVRFMEIGHGEVYALVEGSQRRTYHTRLFLRAFSAAQWEMALVSLSGEARYTAKLLTGEMPEDIEGLFKRLNLALFPQEGELSFECSCPDDTVPCKHVAAVAYLLAERFDDDPFVLFHLRGRSREALLDGVRQRYHAAQDQHEAAQATEAPDGAPPKARAVVLPLPLDADLDSFWRGGPVVMTSMPDPARLAFALRQFGEPPGEVGEPLRAIYAAVRQRAWEWLD